jgi:hypothetical protein
MGAWEYHIRLTYLGSVNYTISPLPPCSKTYTIEEWMHFVETFSRYVFRRSVLRLGRAKQPGADLIYECWGLICQIVDHYMRPAREGPSSDGTIPARGTQQSAKNGAELSSRLGILMEMNGFSSKLFTSNLHMLACRWVSCSSYMFDM